MLNKIAGCILFSLGGLTAWSAATSLSMGSFQHPGSGFLPFALACILCLLSLALVLAGGKGEGRSSAFWPEGTWVRPLLGSLALFAYAVFLSLLGFTSTTFIFMVAWTRLIERLAWQKVLLVAAAVTSGLYLVFVWFLGVPVPVGFWRR